MQSTAFPGLVFALNFDGAGGAIPIPPEQIHDELELDSKTWVHLDYSVPGVEEWLETVGGLDETTIAALCASEPRPRCFKHGSGTVLILRGINQNPDQDPEDMVSLRILANAHCTITLRQRRVRCPTYVREQLTTGDGPHTQGSLLIELAELLTDSIANVVADLDEQADNLEESVLTMESHALRAQLSEMRRKIIVVRRYLSPQRDALAALLTGRMYPFTERDLMALRDITDRTIRYVEDLDAIRDRATVTHEELNARIGERMNRIMYFLSIITGVFLPLGLLTGLLGINVGGMPGADSPGAFWLVCGLMGGIAVFEVWLFKKMKWF